MVYDIPGSGPLDLQTIILDLDGTISVKGKLVEGVEQRLAKLKELGYNIVLFTGNTRGDADSIAAKLNIEWRQAKNSEDKQNEASKLNPETCVSIGNGLIDLELMKTVKLRIVTLQAEGVHVQTLLISDIIVPTIIDALDMLIDPDTLIAKDGKILILKDSSRPDFWDVPGGRIDDDETIEQTLLRELREELPTHTNPKIGRLINAYRVPGSIKDDLGLTLLFYEVSVDFAGAIELSDEHTAYEWLTLAEALERGSDGIQSTLRLLQ